MIISVSPLRTRSCEAYNLTWEELVTWLRTQAPRQFSSKSDVPLFTLTQTSGGIEALDVQAVYGIGLDYDGTAPLELQQALTNAAGLGCGSKKSAFNGVDSDMRVEVMCRRNV